MVEKKKTKRRVVGSVVKARDGGADYIKIREDLVLKQGQTLRLESAKQQLESLESAVSAGKLSEEMADKVRDRISKIPDFVRFEIIMLSQ